MNTSLHLYLLNDGPCVGAIASKVQAVRKSTDKTNGLNENEETNDSS